MRIKLFIPLLFFFFFSSRRRHTRFDCDWSSDVCSSDLARAAARRARGCRLGEPAENPAPGGGRDAPATRRDTRRAGGGQPAAAVRGGPAGRRQQPLRRDRKSTRLNSSHSQISYAVFCLK